MERHLVPFSYNKEYGAVNYSLFKLNIFIKAFRETKTYFSKLNPNKPTNRLSNGCFVTKSRKVSHKCERNIFSKIKLHVKQLECMLFTYDVNC